MKALNKIMALFGFLLVMFVTTSCYAVEMKLYTNEEKNFSLEIPKVCEYYIPTIPQLPPAVMYAASNTGYNIDVKVFPAQDKAEGDDNSLRGLGYMLRGQLRRKGCNLLSEKLIVLDNGKHAIFTSYTKPASYGGGVNLFGTTVQLWTANNIYILNYSLTSLDYDKYVTSISDSYQSFKVLR